MLTVDNHAKSFFERLTNFCYTICTCYFVMHETSFNNNNNKNSKGYMCIALGIPFTSCIMTHNLNAPSWVEEASFYDCFTKIKTINLKWKLQTSACSSALPWAKGGTCGEYLKFIKWSDWRVINGMTPGGRREPFSFWRLNSWCLLLIFGIILPKFWSPVI